MNEPAGVERPASFFGWSEPIALTKFPRSEPWAPRGEVRWRPSNPCRAGVLGPAVPPGHTENLAQPVNYNRAFVRGSVLGDCGHGLSTRQVWCCPMPRSQKGLIVV